MRVSFLSLRSSSSFLRLLPRLPVTSLPPFIFPSITRCRRQFLRKIWQIQLAFRLLISCRIFLCSLTLSNTSMHYILVQYLHCGTYQPKSTFAPLWIRGQFDGLLKCSPRLSALIYSYDRATGLVFACRMAHTHTRPVALSYEYISADSRGEHFNSPSNWPLIHSGSNVDLGWYVPQWGYCTNTMLTKQSL